MDRKKILIAGAGGFVGSHILNHLARMPEFECYGLARGGADGQDGTGIIIPCDVMDGDAVMRVVADVAPDIVIDCAGVTPHQVSADGAPANYAANPIMVHNFVNAIGVHAPHATYIYASSVSVYGAPQSKGGIVREDDGVNPQNPYAQSKVVCERIIRKQTDMKHTIMRIANIAGKDAFINHVLKTHKATLRGEDAFMRDIIHADDIGAFVAAAVRYADSDGFKSQTLNCGSGVGHSFTDLIAQIENQTGQSVAVTHAPLMENDIQRLICDRQKATDVLGWIPKITTIETIIKTAIEHHECMPQTTNGHSGLSCRARPV